MDFQSSVKYELNQLIEFWTTKAVDDENGGFYGRIDAYDVLHPKADKGIILNLGRIRY